MNIRTWKIYIFLLNFLLQSKTFKSLLTFNLYYSSNEIVQRRMNPLHLCLVLWNNPIGGWGEDESFCLLTAHWGHTNPIASEIRIYTNYRNTNHPPHSILGCLKVGISRETCRNNQTRWKMHRKELRTTWNYRSVDICYMTRSKFSTHTLP